MKKIQKIIGQTTNFISVSDFFSKFYLTFDIFVRILISSVNYKGNLSEPC